MILPYEALLLLDLSILATCIWLLLRYGHLSALHPATLYLFFHAYTFTFRLFQLSNGAPTLFERWAGFYLPVTQQEIQRASLVATGTLLLMTLVWLRFAPKYGMQNIPEAQALTYRPFCSRIMFTVLAITLPVGLVALVTLRGHHFIGGQALALGQWSGSSYLTSMTQWFGISLLALIFYYGPRRLLITAFLAYMLVALLSLPFRSMVIVPALFVIFCYMRWHNLRWPTPRLILVSLILALIFVAGKGLGPTLRTGNIASAGVLITQQLQAMSEGGSGNTMFMDMLATALSHVDEQNSFYYGRTYIGLLTLPIPRQLWPDKPGLADWQKEIQTSTRPTGISGMIVTAIGEAYANFGYLGITIYAITLAWLLIKLYNFMTHAPYYSLANYWALCAYSVLIQVFRDGLISFIVFQVSMLMPLTIITILHLVLVRPHIRHGYIVGWRILFEKYGRPLVAQNIMHRQQKKYWIPISRQ